MNNFNLILFSNSIAQTAEKNRFENSNMKQVNYEDEQSPPIENEEWLAFIHMTMKEVLNGEIDSLKHQNLVSYLLICSL